jgi:hypothetical protein
MTIQDIYRKYQIMPNLQMHMYRVTGVAQQMCENISTEAEGQLNINDILTTCLLHDMGNIIKFDLVRFPDFLGSEGLEFWQNVQNEYRQKYGQDEHEATVLIAQELQVSERVQQLILGVSFDHMEEVVVKNDLDQKICEYADDRVTPTGVTSLDLRLKDLEERYRHRYPSAEDQDKRKRFGELAKQLEQDIFTNLTITSADITDLTVNTRLENLRKFEIIGS